jgi:hypothetical protein
LRRSDEGLKGDLAAFAGGTEEVEGLVGGGGEGLKEVAHVEEVGALHSKSVEGEDLIADVEFGGCICAGADVGNKALITDHLHLVAKRGVVGAHGRLEEGVGVVELEEIGGDDAKGVIDGLGGVEAGVVLLEGSIEVYAVVSGIVIVLFYLGVGLAKDGVGAAKLVAVHGVGGLRLLRTQGGRGEYEVTEGKWQNPAKVH